jgi:hypothetical protein
MVMRKIRILFLVLFFLSFLTQIFSQTPDSTKANQEELRVILKKCADYCENLKKMALNFVCQENIEESAHSYKKTKSISSGGFKSAAPVWQVGLKLKRTKKNTFVYDYQMIKKGDSLEEKRTLIKENKKKRNVENAELKIKGIKTKFLAYGPVGFLSRYWQQYFNYEIVGKDEINGKKTLVIDAAPTEEREENYYSGKIWVDENDYTILKIEWKPKYIEGYEEDVTGGIKRTVSWAAFYEFEKNGVRFPSKQLIEEYFITEAGKEYPNNLTTINYDNYKFFQVEVDVDWK